MGPSWLLGRVYFIEAIGADRIKIGFTQGDPENRSAQLQTGCPFPLAVIGSFYASARRESELHAGTPELRARIGELIATTEAA